MKKRDDSKKQKKNLKKLKDLSKLTQIKAVLGEKRLRIKSKRIDKLVFCLSIFVILLAIVGILAVKDKTITKSSITATPELMRAMQYEQFDDGDENLEATDNVKFSAFFLRDLDGDGYAEKVKGTCKEIGTEDTLYMELNVQTEGYLKDAKVEIQGQNFYLQTTLPKDEQLKDNYIGNNVKKIEFNQIVNGTQKLLTGIVRSGDYSRSDIINSAIGNNINNYSREDNKIILTGIYVDENGKETRITKEILLTVDWYGTTETRIYGENQTYRTLSSIIDEANEVIKLNFEVKTEEIDRLLNLKKNHVEGTIPELNGYAPIKVSSKNLNFTYDDGTRTFFIDKEATVDENGTIITSVSRYNYYQIEVVYPLDAYKNSGKESVNIEIPVRTYYEGFNNPNEQFKNPYRSNIASTVLCVNYMYLVEDIETTYLDIHVGRYAYSPEARYMISKQKPLRIYNGISEVEKDDTYIVKWELSTGTYGESSGIILKERKHDEVQISDYFQKVDNTTESMENLTNNIGIAFSGANTMLKEDGWIKVYDDETDNLLVTFTKENWNNYSSWNYYKYEIPVRHIRVETSSNNKEAYLYVYNIKELDDEYITTNYTKEQFDNLKYIHSTLNGYLGENYIGTTKDKALYEAPYSIATIHLNNGNLSTQSTEENEIITINASQDINNNQLGWNDGSFLIKLPQEILEVEINNVTVNNNNIEILTYEIIENENRNFIKINTVNKSDTLQSFELKVDANITPDPRIPTTIGDIELYAVNYEGVEYYYSAADIYDVNDNLNKEELINKTKTIVNLIAPNSLLTNQTASEFDKSGKVIVSPKVIELSPKYVKIDNEALTAKIGIQLTNNYSSDISEILILGKIPFKGNRTVLSDKDLGSGFTTKMISSGIEIPEELSGKIRVYYSEKENPDKDINNELNEWTLAENVTNWDNIKTFLIDFGNEKISEKKEYTFYYTIQMPEDIDFNQTAYSHHGIYFSLETAEGKYRTKTEPNRLGFRLVEKFNLELTKTHAGKEIFVPAATYSVTEINTDGTIGKMRTGVTNPQGTFLMKDLYAEKTYEIQEIKSPEDYQLSEDVIRFIASVNQDDGSISIIKNQGETKEDITVTKNDDEKHKVIVKVEDKPKAKLKITKKEKNTENPVSFVKFRIAGKNLGENGKILTTNVNGETSINGLLVNEEYILQEIKANGYYLENPIKFKILHENGNYSIEIIEGNVLNSSVGEESNFPVASIAIENEKIQTYNLEISKIKKILETELTEEQIGANNTEESIIEYLAGAKFKLYKNSKEIGEYVTDVNGKILISGLYQYVDGKSEEAIYTLKEVLPPEGYVKAKDVNFKVQNINGELKFIDLDNNTRATTVEGSTVKLVVEDSPAFKLIKKDAETGEALANVKFAIYNFENNSEPATNSKGEKIGTLEHINGKDYYTVTTDNNGLLTIDLPEGLYKAIELQAPDKYNIENSIYYFGVGASREGKVRLQADWSQAIGGEKDDVLLNVEATSDGGYIVVGQFVSENIELANGEIINNKNSTYSDGIIIKYSNDGEVEWAKSIGGDNTEEIYTIQETSDGGYIITGTFTSTSIDFGNGVGLANPGTRSGMLVKYDITGNVEWANAIEVGYSANIVSVSETVENCFMVMMNYENQNLDLGNEITLSNSGGKDGAILKYNSEGVLQWAKNIGGSGYEELISGKPTLDGGFIVSGLFSSESIDLENGMILTNSATSTTDGLIIKYDSNGSIEWTKKVGGVSEDIVSSIEQLTDGSYLVTLSFMSSTVDLENGFELTNKVTSTMDSALIKYDSNGSIIWTKSISGNQDEMIDMLEKTADGGFIIQGIFNSESIDLGDQVTLTRHGDNYNSMIVKYNSSGKTEWADIIAANNLQIYSLEITKDNGCLILGQFEEEQVGFGNCIDGSGIIKYNSEGKLDYTWSATTGVYSAKELLDGDILAVGSLYGVAYFDTKLESRGLNDGVVIKLSEKEMVDFAITDIQSESDVSSLTKDGGYIDILSFSVDTELPNGTFLKCNGKKDAAIVKYDSKNNIEWVRTIGGAGDDSISQIIETKTGDYIVGGSFKSNIIELENNITLTNSSDKNIADSMIMKYSENGELKWAKSILIKDKENYKSEDEHEYIREIIETKDGGYLINGYFYDKWEYEDEIYDTDSNLVKFSESGHEEWQRSITGYRYEEIYDILEIDDIGFIVVGGASDSSPDFGEGLTLDCEWNEGFIVNYTANGDIKMVRKRYSSDIKQTSDGGWIEWGTFAKQTLDLGDGFILQGYDDDFYNSDIVIIKYNKDWKIEWAKAIGGDDDDYISNVIETSDGGYLATGHFNSLDINLENKFIFTNTSNSYYDEEGIIIKYGKDGTLEWANTAKGANGREYFTDAVETSDNGYIVLGEFASDTVDLGDGKTITGGYTDIVLVKYNKYGKVDCAKKIDANSSSVYSFEKISEGKYTLEVALRDAEVELDNGEIVTIDDDIVTFTIEDLLEIQETQELIVENNRKEFNITTDIEKTEGVKGGTISGEDEVPYETIKYGDNSTKEIKLVPEGEYEIISIKVNGEETVFNTAEDGSYIMPIFTNVTEDLHIVAKFGLKENTFTINKIDSETKEPLEGAVFKLDQLEERETPAHVIGEINDNGETYYELNKETEGVLGNLVDNGQTYTLIDETNQITDALGELTDNGSYVFVKETNAYGEEVYVPTNSKTYQLANGGAAGISSSVANSYIPIDLTGYQGKYMLVVNATISSGYSDYGYATVTTTTYAPGYYNSTGRFIYDYGTYVGTKNYTANVLEGGKKYYLHLGYSKNYSGDSGSDQIIFNSIKLYGTKDITYNFVEKDGKYESTNQGMSSTVSNSYIPIDLTNCTGKYSVVLNAQVSCIYGNCGYATITQSTSRPAYNSTTGRFVYIDGISSESNNYQSELLEGGKIYYLHLGYYKNATANGGEDKFTVNSVKVYNTMPTVYGFVEEDGKYKSSINGLDSRTANSYFLVDLTDYEGKYNLIVNANISSEVGDYGYATISQNANTPNYDQTEGRFIYISGTTESSITPTDYTTVLEGGNKYYLHVGYYKNSTTNEGDDEFVINSIKVVPNGEHLYHTEVTTNSQGSAKVEIPHGIYSIKEIIAPEGYELNENATVVEFRKDSAQEITIDNSILAKVIVNHNEAIENEDGTVTYTEHPLAEIDILEDKAGHPYSTSPKLDLAEHELETNEDGSYKLPENATGQFVSGEQEVTYYYMRKSIPIIVNHYIEGTETPVILNDGSSVEEIISYGNAGQEYTTQAISAEELHEKYELVEIPSNATGTFEYSDVVVNYYYRIKTFDISTRVEEKIETTVTGETKIVKGGTISGDGEEFYEIVEYGQSNEKEIIVTPEDDAHKVSQITINGENYEFLENEDGTVTLPIFENITEDIKIVVTFERILTKVMVHHYIEGTETSVKFKNGDAVPDEYYEKQYGEIYETKCISEENLYPTYELCSIPNNNTGTVGNDTIIVTYYYKLKDYTLELTKYEAKEENILPGVKFKLIDCSTGNAKEYETDENGRLSISNLIAEKQYEIREIETAEGYLLNNSKKVFSLETVDSKLKLKVLDGSFKETEDEIVIENANGNNPIVKVSLENETIFTLTKKDSKGNKLLPGAKFTIKEIAEENGTTIEKDAKDGYGNLVGQEEQINGENLRVVTTNENGEINIPLKAGKYKLTEVQAPENYLIGENNFHYIEIQANEPPTYDINQTWEGNLYGDKFTKLNDNGFVSFINFRDMIIIPAENTTNNQEIELISTNGSSDIGIIKYNSDFKIEFVKNIATNNDEYVNSVFATSDGGYIVLGEIVGHPTVIDGELQISTENNSLDGAVAIKYNLQGNVEWVNKINSDYGYSYNSNAIETTSGEFVVFGYSSNSITIPAEATVDNQEIRINSGYYVLLLTDDGKIKWIYVDQSWKYYWSDSTAYETANDNILIIPNKYGDLKYLEISLKDGMITNEYDASNYMTSLQDITTLTVDEIRIAKDKCIIITGYIVQNETISSEHTVKGEEIKLNSNQGSPTEFILKLNSDLKIEWIQTFEGSKMTMPYDLYVDEEGKCVILGMLMGNLVINADKTFSNKEITLLADENVPSNLIIKLNDEGKIEWADSSIPYQKVQYQTIYSISDDEYMLYYNYMQSILKETKQEAVIAEKVNLEVTNTYNGPMNEISATLEKNGLQKITSLKTNVNYEIKYNAVIEHCEGKAKVTIVDKLPYPITVEASNLDNGIYDSTTNTITWIEEINNINTFTNDEPQNIEFIKNISLKYNFEENLEELENVENIVTVKIEILTQNEENPDEYIVIKEDEQVATENTPVDLETVYTINYYYENQLNETKTETIKTQVGTEITEYPDKLEEGYEVDRVENLPLIIDEDSSKNIINVYYKLKASQIIVKYLDKETKYELEKDVIIDGKIFDTHDLSTNKKDIEGYTLTWEPENLQVEFTEENQTFIFYYAKNTRVIVKYLEKDDTPSNDDNLVIDEETIIEGYVDKEYKTIQKDIEKYIFAESTENTEGRMARLPIEVIYYYTKQKSGLHEKHVDVKTNEVLDSLYHELPLDETYTINSEEFDGYDIAKNKDIYTEEELTENQLNPDENYIPENFEGIVTIEPIEVKYYYIRKTSVKVEYIDNVTGEVIKETVEIDEDEDGIIDRTEQKDSTEVIEGHEGDEYTTNSKEFDGYILVEEKIPENSEGTMDVVTDEDGNVITETVVKYYYVQETKVIERHIDIKTGKELEPEIIHEGYEGKEYKIEDKEFEGYDLVKEQLPENAEGTMTKEIIEVNYYYIRKAKVVVEYLDKTTGEKIFEIAEKDNDGDGITDEEVKVDSTEEIEGHEGEAYEATRKEFDGYKLIEEERPENEKGTMIVIVKEDGTVDDTIYVRYYYSKVEEKPGEDPEEPVKPDDPEKPGDPEEPVKPNDPEKPEDPEEPEKPDDPEKPGDPEEPEKPDDPEKPGDPEEPEKPDDPEKPGDPEEPEKPNEPEKPGNPEDSEEPDEPEDTKKNAIVIVRYLERGTNKVLSEEVIKEGKVGDDYTTEAKTIELYTLDKEPENKNGVMKEETIIVTYYYYFTNPPPQEIPHVKEDVKVSETIIKPTDNTPKPNNQNETLATGDTSPIIYVGIIIFVAMINIIQIIIRKKIKSKNE
ncbi:MAG: MucBP domain-containing protein [Clostridia bacterium]|nr:MucBP domain-containing protein [Clostridia bacterium]